jgi:drug/metabolite transporter (DMT)-like permease
VLGVLGAGLSFILYISGLKHTAPAVASIVAMVEPVTASLFGVMILNESLVGSQIFGMALILVTVTALSVYSSARQASSALTTR